MTVEIRDAFRGSKAVFYLYSVRMRLRAARRNWRSLAFYLEYYLRLGTLLTERRSEVVTVVSYPKSGRTWLERLLLEALRGPRGTDPDTAETLFDVLRKDRTLPRVVFTHAGSSWESLVLDEEDMLHLRPERFVKGRLLLLVRDPRSVQVSAYYHLRYRTGIGWIRPADMVSHSVVGVRKLVRFMRIWLRYAEEHRDSSLIVRYEELRADPERVFGEICRFIGIDVDEQAMRLAVQRARFERMQQLERFSDGRNPWLTPGDTRNRGSYKVRSGRTDEYLELFSPEELRAMEAIMEEELGLAYGYRRSGS